MLFIYISPQINLINMSTEMVQTVENVVAAEQTDAESKEGK